ncbi:DDE-type integrase/transposase/recombinase [Bacillus siamensis]|uniref:DDE-type integrase/transposase/recombinase n=1 Tax=Bacillus siamensis TaxID=659243 RepID=UPI0022B7B975|nr:DDE-type integrase/transposase/recombinase [Bacillus siamensis]
MARKKRTSLPQPSKQRFFSFETPNEKWVTDITYLMFSGQKLYNSVMKDLYNNEIVAYQISRRNDLKLVMGTLKKQRKNGMM